MRLTGHAVRLVPYSEWLKQLDDETSKLLDHPLRPLRAFFLNRPARGLTLPELYEDVRRTRTINVRTSARLSTAIQRPALDASLLNRYFCAYRAAGYIAHSGGRSEEEPEPTIPGMPDMSGMDEAFFETALAARGHAVRVRTATRTAIGSEHSIISELTAWRSRRPAGLFRYRLELEANDRPRISDVVVKIKPHADDAMAVGEAMARLCDVRVGEAFSRWRERTGLAGSHLRERAIYECGDERLTGCMPALLGALELDDLGACALVMEDVSGALLMDSIDRVPSWRPEHIEVVVRDLASLHAVWYGRATEIERRPWIGFVQSTESMRRMSDLWSALADHSASAFARWAGPDLPRIHRELVGSIENWYPAIEAGPQALVHNDFNPRNICLRERAGALSLCAYDWELATLSTPQRDLAELLCFVLPATARGADIDGWIERHRAGLSANAGVSIDPFGWLTGFHAAMNELLIDRLAMYALVHRVKRQPFLPRVLATWRRIHQHVVEHTR
jgi:aminoglycoside phosphotransferase (APT) family kinase protein